LLRRSVLLVLAALAAVALVAAASSPAASRASIPHRIVSLSPTATDTLFAVGAGKQVVAVDNDSKYPRAAPHTSLSGLTPNVEAIAGYRPDLVVISYDPGGLRSALARLNIRVLEEDAATTLAGAYAEILQIGSATGHLAKAKQVVAGMKRSIARSVAAAHGRGRGLSVYHELDPTLYSATSKTFIGQIYTLFGLKDIADAADASGSGYPQLSAEYVVAQNPDLIVLADTVCCGQNAKTVAARPGWSNIRAVRTGEIVRIDDSIASQWGPRVVLFAKALSQALDHLAAR
jgi:iron complex transport system substrate-binding protein